MKLQRRRNVLEERINRIVLNVIRNFEGISHYINKNKLHRMYRPPKVRPKNLTIGGRYFYGKIQL